MADDNHALDAGAAQDDSQGRVYVPRDSKTDRARARGGVMFSAGYDPRRNTKGRPPAGEALSEIIRELMELPVSTLEQMLADSTMPAKKVTALRQILDGLRQGDDLQVAARVRAYTYNRLDGMPGQKVETSNVQEERMAETMEMLADALREANALDEAREAQGQE